MKVTQITVSYGGKVGLPGFGNREVHAHVQVQVEENDGQEPVMVGLHLADVFTQVKASITEQINLIKAEVKQEQDEIASYLPPMNKR